jgi:hypothetical protein
LIDGSNKERVKRSSQSIRLSIYLVRKGFALQQIGSQLMVPKSVNSKDVLMFSLRLPRLKSGEKGKP